MKKFIYLYIQYIANESGKLTSCGPVKPTEYICTLKKIILNFKCDIHEAALLHLY